MPSTNAVILLVDDEPSVRESLSLALRDEGYTVLEAGSFGHALQVFGEHATEIDLLITDISLPEDNGFELAARISQRRPEVKVIYASGKAGRELCKFYYMPEPDPRLLYKPFQIEELIRRVHDALGFGGTPQLG